MTNEEFERAQRDETIGLAVALLRAGQLGDGEAFDALLASCPAPHDLAALLSTWLNEFGPAVAGGPERWAAMLAAWQPGQRLGDGFDR